ncbi:MAG: helix-turn-helix domain-containing protein [Pseudomonadota bacterium]
MNHYDLTSSANLTSPRLVDERRLAKMTDTSPRHWQNLRMRGEGPPFIKLGKAVRYDLAELEKYFAQQSRTSTSQAGAISTCI